MKIELRPARPQDVPVLRRLMQLYLYDFAANWEGSKAAIASLRPALKARDAKLLESYDPKAKALSDLIAKQRSGAGYKLYTELSKAEVTALSQALDAVSEDVSKVAGVVAGK